jgi:L-2-hydroxycarboxylate dehydrogenase (NAD+)
MLMTGTPEQRERVDPDKLRSLVTSLLTHRGMPDEDARITAAGIVSADLRGHESHGVSNNLFGFYLPGLEAGSVNPRPDIRIIHETPSTARWDADQGMGFVVGHRVMQDVMERARSVGSGFAAVGNSRHFGMAQFYSLMALEHDMVGLSMTNGVTPGVVPFGGRDARLSTNPISVAIPAGDEPPFVLDMSTTPAPFGKVQNYVRDGKPIPAGWALDANGVPTTDPEIAMEGLRLLPLGSSPEGSAHKGYGLGTWVDLFCGGLSSFGFIGRAGDTQNVNHFFGAWRVDAFMPAGEFKALMDERLRELKATPTAPGFDRVQVAGLPEWETQEDRLAHGIPLHADVLAELRERADSDGIPYDLSFDPEAET